MEFSYMSDDDLARLLENLAYDLAQSERFGSVQSGVELKNSLAFFAVRMQAGEITPDMLSENDLHVLGRLAFLGTMSVDWSAMFIGMLSWK